MKSQLFAVAAFSVAMMMSTTVHAADCVTTAEDEWELDDAGVNELYDCIKDQMLEKYNQHGDEIAKVYRDWAPTATRPAVAGAHQNRLLYTFVNDIGAEQYLKFEEEGVEMPVGSILAKESIRVNAKKGKGVVGPFFTMTKLEKGAAPETDDWLYGGLFPNGKSLKFTQKFCHDCHGAFEGQDSLGYPVEEVRVGQ